MGRIDKATYPLKVAPVEGSEAAMDAANDTPAYQPALDSCSLLALKNAATKAQAKEPDLDRRRRRSTW